MDQHDNYISNTDANGNHINNDNKECIRVLKKITTDSVIIPTSISVDDFDSDSRRKKDI